MATLHMTNLSGTTLQEAKGQDPTRDKYRIHMANIQKIRDLAEADFSPHEIAKLLNLPIELVKKDSAHIARDKQNRRKFLAESSSPSCHASSPGGPEAPVTIIGSLPVGCNVNLIYTAAGP